MWLQRVWSQLFQLRRGVLLADTDLQQGPGGSSSMKSKGESVTNQTLALLEDTPSEQIVDRKFV